MKLGINEIRRRRNLFCLLLFLTLLFLPTLVSGLEISLLWSAGLNHSFFSLVNRNLSSWVERIHKEASIQGWQAEASSVPRLQYGYEMEIGLQITLTSRWSLGLSSGILYFELTEKKTSIPIKKDNTTFYYAHPTKAAAVPIGLNLIYFLPLTKNFRFFIKGKAGLLFARYVDREANRKEADLKFVYPAYQNATASSPFMLLGLGFDFQPETAASFFLEAAYRQAQVTGFKGVNKTGQKGSLEFYEEYFPSLDLWQARLLIVTAEPNPEFSRNRQKSVIDFSGFSIKIGMTIKF